LNNSQIWDYRQINDRIQELLSSIEEDDISMSSDISGGGCSNMVCILFVLELISDKQFYGSIEITSKGGRLIKPSISKQTFKMDEKYKDLIL
jgi:hypothetical protein